MCRVSNYLADWNLKYGVFFPRQIQTVTVKEGNLASTRVEHLTEFDRHNRKQPILSFVWMELI